jgi:hypothetical protein
MQFKEYFFKESQLGPLYQFTTLTPIEEEFVNVIAQDLYDRIQMTKYAFDQGKGQKWGIISKKKDPNTKVYTFTKDEELYGFTQETVKNLKEYEMVVAKAFKEILYKNIKVPTDVIFYLSHWLIDSAPKYDVGTIIKIEEYLRSQHETTKTPLWPWAFPLNDRNSLGDIKKVLSLCLLQLINVLPGGHLKRVGDAVKDYIKQRELSSASREMFGGMLGAI